LGQMYKKQPPVLMNSVVKLGDKLGLNSPFSPDSKMSHITSVHILGKKIYDQLVMQQQLQDLKISQEDFKEL